MIESITRFCVRHAKLIIVLWVFVAVLMSIIAFTTKPRWLEGGYLPKSDSSKAMKLAQEAIPEMAKQSGERSGKIVFFSKDGIESHRGDITNYLDSLVQDSKKTNIVSVSSPFEEQSNAISKDGTIAYANIGFSDKVKLNGIDKETVARAKELRTKMTVEFAGYLFNTFSMPKSEIIGITAALIILFVAFGSLVAAGLPIFSALVGIGVGASLVRLMSHVISAPEPSMNIAMMIAIGVGIDYALFIVTRFKQARSSGANQEESVVEAMNTSGSAVLFAGITVVISLLGMVIIGLSFTTGMALSASLAVLVMLFAAMTFVPALLGSAIGRNIDKSSLPHRKKISDKPAIWVRWSEYVQRHSISSAIVATLFLLILTIPFFSLNIGIADEGNGSKSLTTRRAYDLLAKGFGPGFNGPLLMMFDLRDASSPAQLISLVQEIENTKGVQSVMPTSKMIIEQASKALAGVDVTSNASNPDQQKKLEILKGAVTDANKDNKQILQQENLVVPIQIFPTTSPQDKKTTDLVHNLRNDIVPTQTRDSGIKAYIGGITAANIDLSDYMSQRIGFFIGAVLVLSFLLLLSVFRSILIAIKAVIMNLLSIGAAYGIIVAIFQWGWGTSLLGIHQTGPIEPWAPMMLFAIVFGLSMDYEVFLLSKIKEEYELTKDNSASVTHGLAATARVITAAATIMVCVFGSFVIADIRILKLMGIGLAVAVFLDATVVRMLLVPATMELLGDKNWWIPKWLDKLLPQIHVESTTKSKDNLEHKA